MFLRRITPREEICTGEGGLACETNNQPIPFPGCRSNLPISGRDIFKRCAPEKNEKLSIYCAFVFRTQGFPSRMLCLDGGVALCLALGGFMDAVPSCRIYRPSQFHKSAVCAPCTRVCKF